ncbi:MAG: hypothetical protein IID40_09210 [Planctomycetes bacterium]|nr:hypothetical protein [Planctomycetota bacterium]
MWAADSPGGWRILGTAPEKLYSHAGQPTAGNKVVTCRARNR